MLFGTLETRDPRAGLAALGAPREPKGSIGPGIPGTPRPWEGTLSLLLVNIHLLPPHEHAVPATAAPPPHQPSLLPSKLNILGTRWYFTEAPLS